MVDDTPGMPWRMPRTRTERLAGLIGCLVLCYAASGLGSIATARSVATWYQTLAKPGFTPPDWVFAPVWSTLYTMMAVALWLVWRKRGVAKALLPVAAFLAQLILNVAWSWLFFGYRWLGAASVEIVVLLLAIAATALAFWRIDRIAGMLLVPYLCWVVYAAVLTFSLWRINPVTG